ncbi:hypothetical protein PHMEG_00029922 [Phytophthora megakarya]|uniref:Uncharacterized protein n=1 Tax=Phytophthora megakarya TaxID=4795 RepID=A0A225V1X1_9STRA|nr:hypothetical protein PHMEG_00029922 [Phytophthora megakarya]
MMKAHKSVDNLKPPMPANDFVSWEAFSEALETYQESNYVLSRIRTSETRAQAQRRRGTTQIPSAFQYHYQRWWCTHAGSQKAAIIRQLHESMRKHTTVSRHPDTIPEFLILVSRHLSDYAVGKVREQWDMYMGFTSTFHVQN